MSELDKNGTVTAHWVDLVVVKGMEAKALGEGTSVVIGLVPHSFALPDPDAPMNKENLPGDKEGLRDPQMATTYYMMSPDEAKDLHERLSEALLASPDPKVNLPDE